MQGAAEGLTSGSFLPLGGRWQGLVSRAPSRYKESFSMNFDRYLSTSEDELPGTGHKV
jgi:hypothetical protein